MIVDSGASLYISGFISTTGHRGKDSKNMFKHMFKFIRRVSNIKKLTSILIYVEFANVLRIDDIWCDGKDHEAQVMRVGQQEC